MYKIDQEGPNGRRIAYEPGPTHTYVTDANGTRHIVWVARRYSKPPSRVGRSDAAAAVVEGNGEKGSGYKM